MSWKVTIIIAALVFPLAASADFYVKRETHTDGYYAGGRMTPPDDSAVEMWIGDQRLAYITDGLKCVVDVKKKTLIFINRRDNTYVETALPLDMSKLFSEEDLGMLQVYIRTGKVKKLEGGKKIGKWDATPYETRDWINFEGGRVSERTARIWITTDVPFDLKKFNAMFSTMLSLRNLSDEYLQQITMIGGLEVAGEETTYQESIAITTASTLVELTEKEPGAEAYALPDGCTKKEILTLNDLRD